MDTNVKQPLASPELLAFRHYYDYLLSSLDHPVDFAEGLISAGVVNREVKDSITSTSEDVEQGRVILDACEHALLQSSQPSATLERLVTVWREACSRTKCIRSVLMYIYSECTITLINAR